MMKTISLIRAVGLALLAGCSAVPESGKRTDDIARVEQMGDADKLYIVDCLLPGQIRKLGRKMTFLTARRPIKTTAVDCEIRGGEYVAYDRANYATSLNIWLPKAQSGDPEAQAYTGEIYEKGQGTQPDYKTAADWYRKASAQGNSRAQINLGHLYEKGLGVEKNLSTAMEWYQKASGLEKKDLPYASTFSTSSDEELIAEIQVLKRELDNSRNQSKALAEQLSNTQRQLQETLEKQQRFQNERDKTKSRLDDAQTKGNAIEGARLEKILHEKDNELVVLQQQVSALNSQYQLKVDDLKLKLEDTEKRAEQISGQLKVQQSAAGDTQLVLVNAEAKLANTEKKLLEVQKDFYSKTDVDKVSKTSHANSSQDMQRKLEQSQALISQLESEKQKLQQEVDKIQKTSAPISTTQKPVIEIIDPPLVLQRGTMPTVTLRSLVKEREIFGKATSPAGIVSVMVNDVKNTLDRGLFKATVGIKGEKTPVSIVAVDQNGARASLEFLLSLEGSATANPIEQWPRQSSLGSLWKNIDFGNYYALIIGNNHYKKIQSLDTPINDAQAVDRVLREKYGFNTKLLIDADRYQILTAMNDLRAKLTENDNLLIYYAGHGELDRVNMRGHWLPVDADADNNANWISTIAITDILNAMSPRHILVVADSCYSGTLTRSSLARLEAGMSEEKKSEWVKAMLKGKSRVALTSGGLKPVADGGSGGHSIFASAFIKALQNNNSLLEGQELYRNVSSNVIAAAERIGVEQVPQYDPLKFAGHEVGDFFFMSK